MKTIYISNETLMEMIQETYLRIVKEQLRESKDSGKRSHKKRNVTRNRI